MPYFQNSGELRIKALLPVLTESMERYGHLRLDPVVRSSLLARWTAEIIDAYNNGQAEANGQKIERSIALLSYMNRAINLSHNYAIACAVLSLHRFVIGVLVKAKAEGYSAPLKGVSSVLLALAELFATIRSGNESGMLPGEVRR